MGFDGSICRLGTLYFANFNSISTFRIADCRLLKKMRPE